MFTTDADDRMWMNLRLRTCSKEFHGKTCASSLPPPNELGAEIHNRMPVILPPETHDRWLTGEAGKEILLPFPAEAMKIRAVSRRVNKPENNDPGLLEEGKMEQVGRLI
jgi:putative SOS response-associated peptidase YedK